MGIAGAFYTALSGLSVNSASLTVIGNNLANLNTIGFKGSSTTFQDLFSTTLGASAYQGNGNPSQVGLGATVGAVNQNFGQSTFQSTSNPTDMAIQGAGFFYMSLVNGGFGHTRAGNFTVNQFGFVVDPSGNKLQGYNRDSRGVIDTTMGSTDIQLPVGATIPAKATEAISFTTNLDASASLINSRYTTSVQTYDSLGTRHNLLITYEKVTYRTHPDWGAATPPVSPTAPLTDDDVMPNLWRYFIWSPDSNPKTMPPPEGWQTGGGTYTPGTDYEVLAQGLIGFDTGGLMDGNITHEYDNFVTPDPYDPLATPPIPSNRFDAAGNPVIEVTWNNGSASQKIGDGAITWTLNTAGPLPETPNYLLTQTDGPSGTSNTSQNGYGAGTIKGLTVDQNGFIIGTFTNGQTYAVARVAMSIFTNNHGLEKVGENIWKETIASGPASIGTANDVGRGAVLGSHYEMSNVDVADEFTRLIITQRGYQANSRIVTTSDEMMQETLSLKR